MHQILVLKRKQEAYLALFYDKCELLTEMMKPRDHQDLQKSTPVSRLEGRRGRFRGRGCSLAKNYLFMLLTASTRRSPNSRRGGAVRAAHLARPDATTVGLA